MPPKTSKYSTQVRDVLWNPASLKGGDDAVLTRHRLRDQRRREIEQLYRKMLPVRESRDQARTVICNQYHQQCDVGPHAQHPLVQTLCEGSYYLSKPADGIKDLLPAHGLASRVSDARPSTAPAAHHAEVGHEEAAKAVASQTTTAPKSYVPRVHPFPQDDSHDYWGKKVRPASARPAAPRQRDATNLQRCAAPIPIDVHVRRPQAPIQPAPFAPDVVPTRVSLEAQAAEKALNAKPLVTRLPLPVPEPQPMKDAQTAIEPPPSCSAPAHALSTAHGAPASGARPQSATHRASSVPLVGGRNTSPPRSVESAVAMLPKMGRDEAAKIVSHMFGTAATSGAVNATRAGQLRYSNRPLDSVKFMF